MMKNRTFFFTILFLLLSIICIHSQEKSRYKCAYEANVVRDTVTHESFGKDTYIVQINENMTKGFYYVGFYSDSLKNVNKILHDQMMTKAFTDASENLRQGISSPYEKAFSHLIPRQPFNSILYKDYKKNEMRIVDLIVLVNEFIFTEELEPQDWTILSDTMTILGYHSQKATCHYRGRNWIAWFTSEIPLSEGPWKFYGLPGLITKISDEKDHYGFVLTGFQEIEEPIDTKIPTKAEKTTREKFIKAWRRERIGKFGANRTMESAGISRPVVNKNKGGQVRYDYIETE